MGAIPDKLNLALPDGHLMNHVLKFLEHTGIAFDGYVLPNPDRRPVMKTVSDVAARKIAHPERVAVKVVRPQDMPTHVANGNFDLAISGTDWLAEHRHRFSGSPVVERLRLGFGKVRIVAAAHKDHGNNLQQFIQSFRQSDKRRYLRIASEYVYLADAYAQRMNLHPFRVIMTYGATESLIPEDCDMIIENTETGNTLRKNHLDIVDTLSILGKKESEGCLIASAECLEVAWKRELIESMEAIFKEALSKIMN